jgi:hypothetical protein
MAELKVKITLDISSTYGKISIVNQERTYA